MSKALENLLKAELEEIKQSLSDEKATKEEAEATLKSSSQKIEQLNKAFYKISAQLEAIEEDKEAVKVAANGFLKGLQDDKTKLSDESKLNFQGLCEALGIEIEIDADENAETDEETEEGGEILQTGT